MSALLRHTYTSVTNSQDCHIQCILHTNDCISLNKEIHLPDSAYDVNNTYPQALAGNPGSYSGFVSLLHASVCRFRSLLGPSVTQCNMNPPEKHTKENDKY